MNSEYRAKSQKHASHIHYTITPIKDLEKWRNEQAEAEKVHQEQKEARWQEVRATATKMVEDQISTVAFTDQDKAEILYRARRAGVKIIGDAYSLSYINKRTTPWQRFVQWIRSPWT